jgi:alkanesulfonate monooxygenase SsuD/methylene tetrahydromethanopterin reductase-like flavin-dependent oxidoreductase (luciferase family)
VTLSVGVGPITLQRGDDEPRDASTLWADALDLAAQAERLGYQSVWVGEHHVTGDGHLGAVFPFLAALAVRTTSVLIGTKVLLAPLHHPLRVAEDAAAVQTLSRGRLVIGAAIGYRPAEFEAFGVSLSSRRRRLEDLVAACRRFWAGGPVDGIVGAVSDLLDPPVPFWLGGRAPAALERAGRLGDGFAAPAGTPEDLRAQVAAVDAASAASGRADLPVASSSFVVLHAEGVASARVRAGYDRLMRFYAGTKADDPNSRVGRASTSDALVIEGDAATVIDRILEYRAALPPGREHHHLVRLDYPGMTATEARDHLRAFAEHVLPFIQGTTEAASPAGL